MLRRVWAEGEHKETDPPDATGQHGLDHPATVIHLPELVCECTNSQGSTTSFGREQGGAPSSIETSACREGGEVHWIVSISGLVAGFVYEVHFELEWSGENAHKTVFQWNTVFTSSTRSYTVRLPLQRTQKARVINIDASAWDAYTPHGDPFFVEVTVRDMHPGLTSEDALIGARRMNSALNAVGVRCRDLESGDRTSD